MLSRNDLVELGFKDVPNFTAVETMIYDLGRNRQLSVSSVGTPCEMVYVCEIDEYDSRVITDLVCLHNYDYDGYVTIKKLKSLIFGITGN